MVWFVFNFIVVFFVLFDAKKRRVEKHLNWVALVIFLGPIALPFYFSKRNLLKGEVREGGFGWSVAKYFAMTWSVFTAFAVIEYSVVVSSMQSANEFEEIGAAIGATIGYGLMASIWFFVVLSSLIIGLFLKKNTIIETGPTGQLVSEEPADVHFKDLLEDLKLKKSVNVTPNTGLDQDDNLTIDQKISVSGVGKNMAKDFHFISSSVVTPGFFMAKFVPSPNYFVFMNWYAFFLSYLYYLYMGMWKKALTLIGVSLLGLLLCALIAKPLFVVFAICFCFYCGLNATYDLYRSRVLKEEFYI